MSLFYKQNQTYAMAYDSFGNMTSIAVGDRTLAFYAYGSGNGNLQSMTYGNGMEISYDYDNLDRVTHEYWNDTIKYKYFYDSEGNLAKKLDVSKNQSINYEYDSLGRLIRTNQISGTSIQQRTEHLYDTENRITSQTWKLGSKVYKENYTYDADDGSMTGFTTTRSGTTICTATMAYDALKRLSTRTTDAFTETYTYRNISSTQTTPQVASISYGKVDDNSFSTFVLNYTYDEVGNITQVSAPSGFGNNNATYTYDDQGQLLTEDSKAGTWTYAYDTYGNIRSATNGTTTHTYTYGDENGWYDLLTAYDGESITSFYQNKKCPASFEAGQMLILHDFYTVVPSAASCG